MGKNFISHLHVFMKFNTGTSETIHGFDTDVYGYGAPLTLWHKRLLTAVTEFLCLPYGTYWTQIITPFCHTLPTF